MKKIQYIILMMALTFTGCNNWLDVKPENQVSEEDQLSTREGVDEVVNGLYIALSSRNSYGLYLTGGVVDALGQLYHIDPYSQSFTHEYSQVVQYNYNLTKPYFEAIWVQAYNHIANVNNLIQKLPITKHLFTEVEYNTLRAELYGLRAFLHFDMLRLFGPVPLAENAGIKAIPYYTFRTTEPQPVLTLEEVYAMLDKDLKNAEYGLLNDPLFQNSYGQRRYRMNYIAVKTLQARLELYKGNKTGAAQIARSLIGTDGGVATFVKTFAPWVSRSMAENSTSPDRFFVNEAIFSMENSGKQSTYNTSFEYNVINPNFLAPTMSFFNSVYENRTTDFRYNSWRFNPGNGREIEFAKYQIVNWPTVDKNDQPLIRKSELYLILAETTDNPTEAINIMDVLYVNRGFASGYVSTILGQTTWDEFLRKEYIKEFYGEGQYFFYLKRKNAPTIFFQAGDNDMAIGAAQYVVPLPDSEIKFRD